MRSVDREVCGVPRFATPLVVWPPLDARTWMLIDVATRSPLVMRVVRGIRRAVGDQGRTP